MTDTKPTPRTDAAVVHREYILREMDIYSHKFVLADFARTLERELAAIKDAGDDVVEPERIKYVRVEVECGNLSDYKDFIDYIDSLQSALQVAQMERTAERERGDQWETTATNLLERAEKAEQERDTRLEQFQISEAHLKLAEAGNKRLTEYATHLPECDANSNGLNGDCDCGLAELLREVGK